MLIRDIDPIKKVGTNLLKEKNAQDLIDSIIELPLRKACKIFREKGIETFMSSANKNNLLKPEESRFEKEDISANFLQSFLSPPDFEKAGKGYAWIMLNFDTLSDENKDLLFYLESLKGSNGEKLGEKVIWFVHPCEMGNLVYDMQIGKYTYDDLKAIMPEDEIPQGIAFDEKLAEFEKRHIVLRYNGGLYSMQTVLLRMPLQENTTVEEVENYFSKLARCFKSQVKRKEKETEEEVK